MSDTTTYQQAVSISGLSRERQAALVEHLLSRNHALADRPPVSPAVARCAAALLAADSDQRLSSPTALAQAEALAQTPRIGSTLMQLQEGLIEMESLETSDLARPGILRDAIRIVLQHLLLETARVVNRLEQPEAAFRSSTEM